MDKECRNKINDLEKEKVDLLVVIDTLQIALKRSQNILKGSEDYDYVFTQSAIWSIDYGRQG